MTKTVYAYNALGYYTGTETAFESPLEPGVYLMPANCTDSQPPAADPGSRVKWDGGQWVQEAIPQPAPPTLDEMKAAAKAEANSICDSTIYNGVDVQLADGSTKHFAMTVKDQIDIDSLFFAVVFGAVRYPYHADSDFCDVYSAADLVAIYLAYKTMATQQTSYCNLYKKWVERVESAEELAAIHYGDPLPEDLAARMQEMLTTAQEENQRILARIQAGAGGEVSST